MENLQLKRYTIREKVGEGGMADVYLAYDNVLNRECAIKIMKLELASDPVARIRFRREADAAATLQHPNIVTIYDVGESNNRPFIVMEYVRGLTLKSLIQQRGAIEKREAIFIATQIAEGLQAAHDAGVIHRDVKPHNILIKADSTAKITDFGIASVQGAIQLTQHDSVMGSVHYLAPECSRGESASEQSDIYSLGIVLYEMLTGDVPYKGDAAVQVAMKHMQEDIPSIRSMNNSIEQSIENIIIKATSKNKLTRYQSAQEMLEDLRQCLKPEHAKDKKIQLAPATPMVEDQTRVFTDLNPESTTKTGMSTRDKVLIGIIGLAVLGLIFLLITSLLGNTSEPETFEMIDVSELSIEEATEQLEALNLEVSDSYTYEPNSDIEVDHVIRTSPESGVMVSEGDEVYLVVSSGESFIMSDFRGRLIEEVREELEAYDFISVKVDYEETNDYEPNEIIDQEGAEVGDELSAQEEYTLTFTVAEPEPFQIPDLTGAHYQEAKSELERLGARVELDPQDSSTLSDEEWLETEFEVVTSMSPRQNTTFTPSERNQITLQYWSRTEREVVQVDKESLIERINFANQLDTSLMTNETVYALELAIQNAQLIVDNDNASQSQVDGALATINEAINLLRPIPVTPSNPTMNTLTEGDDLLSGIADPVVSIRVTNAAGQQIGLGMTNADGSFSISITPQPGNTRVFVTASNTDGLTSETIGVDVVALPDEPEPVDPQPQP